MLLLNGYNPPSHNLDPLNFVGENRVHVGLDFVTTGDALKGLTLGFVVDDFLVGTISTRTGKNFGHTDLTPS